eukprot:GHVP01062890.1.p1 GENE.GHVP01062890.1~~GHVP01062890.1.p1  ORF type:complete len:102 (+),score=11.28 GHVP01062890.1:373-678(+)
MLRSLAITMIYKCKYCRFLICEDKDIVHGNNQKKEDGKKCTSYFLNETYEKWGHGFMSKKLECLNCKKKIGQLTWIGLKCGCGEWIVPAITVNYKAVDTIL